MKPKIILSKSNKFLFLFIFLLIFFSVATPLLTAGGLGTAQIIKSEAKEWKVTHTTDTDYIVWIGDKNKQKTEICLLSKTATKMNDIAQDKNTYKKDKASLEKLTRKQVKAEDTKLGKDYYGYCKLIDTEEYIKFGEASTIVEYQEESKVQYISEYFETNITLLKNLTGNYEININDIFIFYQQDKYKFGAIDSSLNDTEHANYRYVINSTGEIEVRIEETETYTYPVFYITKTLSAWGEQEEEYTFEDICQHSYSNCQWEINGNSVIIDFVSGVFIDPTIFPSGNGSIGNPYQITNCSLLQAMNESLTSHYILMNNIDCSGITFTPVAIGNVWAGSLNGQGYSISNLFVTGTGLRVGMFSDLNGNISNVNLINISVTGNDNVGGLVGYQRGGTIRNSNIYGGSVTGILATGNVGGFAGRILGATSFIINSTANNMQVINNNATAINVGGFVGLTGSNAVINRCGVNSTNITANGINVNHIGGFAGRTEAPVYSSYADNIKVISSGGGEYFGGFIGYNAVAGASVNNSWARGSVISNGTYTGGFSGRIASTTIFNSYAKVNVSSTGDYVAGFIGYLLTGGNISNSYSMGNVNYTTATYRGGFAGRNSGGTLANDYYDTNTSGQSDTGRGIPLSTAQMKQQASFVNWDFLTPVWYIIENVTYPSLSFLSYTPPANDTTFPNGTLISPPNATFTNQTSWNFTINATDDQNLSNLTLYIYNETGGLVNQTTIGANGTGGIFGIIYNFFTDGIFTWFYNVADWVGNTFTTIANSITIDTEAPVMNYVSPTETNNSLVIDNIIEVNVTAIDRNLSFIEIFLYNSTGSLRNSTISLTSPAYLKHTEYQNGIYYFNATACDSWGYCENLPIREITIANATALPITFDLEMSQYPYVDINTTIAFRVLYKLGDTYPTGANIILHIYSPDNNVSFFSMNYNATSQRYESYLAFGEVGDYSFIINSTDITGNIVGVFFVREPYYMTFKLFKSKQSYWFFTNKYENEMAYITAELPVGNRYYDPRIEPFFASVRDDRYIEPVWYAEYTDGEATLKLYEQGEHIIRIIDGEIIFPSEYSVPNVTKSYGINAYLGMYNFNGSSSSYELLVTTKDLHPYRWLLNWGLVLGIILVVLLSVIFLFILSETPYFAIIFGVGFSFLLIILRIILFIYWKM
jgi:hypothetical protein